MQTQFSCTVSQCTARENSRRLATPSMISQRNLLQPVGSPTQIWVVTRGFSDVISRGTSGCVAQCRRFSQVTECADLNDWRE